jgi:class 3 adenylate cyclase
MSWLNRLRLAIHQRLSRKFSLFTLVLVAISISTAIYLPASTLMDLNDRRDQIVLQKEKKLLHYLSVGQALYLAGADKELHQILIEAFKQAEISYFVVYKSGQLTHVFPPGADLAVNASYLSRSKYAGKDLIDTIRSERSEFLANDLLLTIGIDKRDDHLLWATIFESHIWKVILQDILTVIALAALAFWLHTRDLMKLKSEIQKTGRFPTGATNRSGISSEAEAIFASFRGYANSEKQAREKNTVLQTQVLPALQREIFSGQSPPYTFDCTLVRTDINGFSQIFNSDYRERFAEHINTFFMGLTEIASRYDGLIYEFVGDEAIYYFKDTPGKNTRDSVARSIDAIRDIHTLAQEINSRTQLEGHRFTVKSALAHGTLRFARLVDGLSLSGGVLIETVRILSVVTDKSENQLYLSARHQPDLDREARFEVVGDFSLKGYSESVTLLRLVSMTSLQHHLSIAPNEGFEFVSKFRNDHSLETLIGTAASAGETWSVENHLGLIEALRPLVVFRSQHSLAQSLNKWLETSVERAKENSNFVRVTSAIVMLYPSLIPKIDLNDETILRLESLLDSKDERTIANTIDVLTKYAVTPAARPMRDLTISENNRVAANALIHAGSLELDVTTLQELEKMIFSRSSDDGRKASGLYAMGEIGRLLKFRDPVYYSTRVDFHKLVQRTSQFLKHSNSSVATQTQRARAKCLLEPSESFNGTHSAA